jgi:uncharacterized protein YuzE
MKITYDASVDALSIQFTSGKGKRPRTVEVAAGVHVDLDANDRLIALELLDASSHLPMAQLKRNLAPASARAGHRRTTRS